MSNMKKVRVLINMVLGACSLLLAGCGVKKAVEHQPMPLYGVPVEYYQDLEQVEKDADRINKENEEKKDSIASDTIYAAPAPGIMVKYGVPRPQKQQ